jgi:hypothetical protein
MNPVFFQYSKDNILDQVINLFVEKGWKSFQKGDHLLNHCYMWPDIVLSDKKNGTISEKGIEALGTYTPNATTTEDGTVTLYIQTIKSTAQKYKEEQKLILSLDEIIEKLSTLVLIHEFAHWIILIGFGRDQITPVKLKYSCDDSIFFHESLAQIVTNYFCSKDPTLKHIFDWMEKYQPQAYIVYNEIFHPTKKVAVSPEQINRIIYIVILLQIRKATNSNNQSYDLLKEYYDQLKALDDNKIICTEIIDLIIDETVNKRPNKFVEYPELVIRYLRENKDIQAFKKKYFGEITGKKFGLS